MKKALLIIIALSTATVIYPAAAQMETNAPPDNGGAPADNGNLPPGMTAPDTGGPPPDMNGAPPQAPSENPALEDNSGQPGYSSEDRSIAPTKPFAANQPALASEFAPPESGTNADELRLNFRNAPLEMVLNYLSDAAGFIIVLDTPVHGNVSVISSHPMTRDEAVDLLNEVLNQNGYAAIRDGRTLTILDKNDAKTRDIPVKVSNDPDTIPKNDEIVTQIIPIRFVDAGDLVKDLSSFVSPQATVVANDAGNSIVITDTQSNIRHIVEIIKAIDSSAEAETEIRVFRLKYASPTDVANELSSIFPSSTSGSSNTPQFPFRFGGGGFGRFFGGGGGGGGGGTSGSSTANDRIKKAEQVTAVADSRIQAVIVTAPKDLIEEIAAMMKDLDVPSDRDQNVYVFHMDNADPQQAVQVLQNMFQSTTSTRGSGSSSSSQTSALQQREQSTATTTSTSSSTTAASFTGNGAGAGAGAR